MSDVPSGPSINTFVVRIWCESSLDASRWRGRVEHLQSGERLAFEELERVLTFIRDLGIFNDDQRRETEVHDDA